MAATRSKSSSNIIASALCLALVFCLAVATGALADSALMFKEAQLVLGPGQSSAMPMQQPSLGLDYLQRFSGDAGDRALLAFQGRLAWNGDLNRVEPQLFNSYLKIKNPLADLWLGHSRVAYGLNSYFDSHALLLAPLSMTDFGFENSWGAGVRRDTDWGDLAVSYTANNLISGRVSIGVLNQNNYNLGLSRAQGNLSPNIAVEYTGVDAALLVDNYELRAENTSGARDGAGYHSILVRGGIKLLADDRLKFELQQQNSEQGTLSDRSTALGLTYLYDENLTFRFLGQKETMTNELKLTIQGYYYAPW
ncbi:MAG: hypothetical protein MUC35_04025 [Candidatus Margulisbacteria bacterium]|jgi:hypothetical protein|nr:hypothetical protein [Candidatus Margulisiibacteriota bacterium]